MILPMNCKLIRIGCVEAYPLLIIERLKHMQAQETIPDPRRWLALIVILAATFMAILDTFVVNVAVPSIQRNLHATFAQVELVIAGYTLVYAVMMITGGRLGDLYGRKRLFQVGMLSFTVLSLFCGLAPNINTLIVLRILQGFSAALMTPQVVALIQVNFAAKERGVALGFYGATVGIASITGQIVGGLLITSDVFGLGWRSVFLVNVPIGILTLIATFLLIGETQQDKEHHLDLVGVAILTAGLFLLTYPLIEGHGAGWPLWTFVCLLCSVPVLIAFVFYEARLAKSRGVPLVPLELFKQRSFSLGVLTALTYYSENGALFFILALYLQFGIGYSPLSAGLTFLPLGLGFFATSLIAPRFVPRLGPWVLRYGTIIMGIGEIWTILAVQQAGLTANGFQLALPLLIVGFGEGIIAAPLMNVVLAGIQARNVGAASGLLTTTIQISQALGIAVIGLVFFEVLGASVPGHPLAAGHSYGQAFIVALYAIVILAVATLLITSLLPATKKNQHKALLQKTEGVNVQEQASRT